MGFTIPKTGGTSFLWSVASSTGRPPLPVLTLNQQTMADARLRVAHGQPLMWNFNEWGKGLARFRERPPEALLAAIQPQRTIQHGPEGEVHVDYTGGEHRTSPPGTNRDRGDEVRALTIYEETVSFDTKLKRLRSSFIRLHNLREGKTKRYTDVPKLIALVKRRFSIIFNRKYHFVLDRLEEIRNQRMERPVNWQDAEVCWKLLHDEFCPSKTRKITSYETTLRENPVKRMLPRLRKEVGEWQALWLAWVKIRNIPVRLLYYIVELAEHLEPRKKERRKTEATRITKKRGRQMFRETVPSAGSAVTNAELAVILRTTDGNRARAVGVLEGAQAYYRVAIGDAAVEGRIKQAASGDPLYPFRVRKGKGRRFDNQELLEALKQNGGDQTKAARQLGVTSRLVSRRILDAPKESELRAYSLEGRTATRNETILRLLAEGKTQKEVAAQLGINRRTVSLHKRKKKVA